MFGKNKSEPDDAGSEREGVSAGEGYRVPFVVGLLESRVLRVLSALVFSLLFTGCVLLALPSLLAFGLLSALFVAGFVAALCIRMHRILTRSLYCAWHVPHRATFAALFCLLSLSVCVLPLFAVTPYCLLEGRRTGNYRYYLSIFPLIAGTFAIYLPLNELYKKIFDDKSGMRI